MGYRFRNWKSSQDRDTDGSGASGTKSYHNGGVEGSRFAKWYDQHLAAQFADDDGDANGSGSGGTRGSGSGGTRGSGSGGTKGSGSGGTRGSGSGGTKGSGSGGTRGSGSGGTKGSGSGGTRGSGSGGTRGSGSGGSNGSGSGGTNGGGDPVDPPASDKSVLNFVMGDPAEINISVTETPEGQLHFNMSQTDFAGSPSDIDGIFFDMADDSQLGSLNFFPEENSHNVTDIQAEANGVSALPNGAGVGQNFDVGLQFGTEPDSSEGSVNNTSFTLWSDDGPVTLEDIDLNGMRVIVDSDGTGGEVLGVSGSDHPDFMDGDGQDDSDIVLEDVMSLMSGAGTEEETDATAGDEMEEFIV